MSFVFLSYNVEAILTIFRRLGFAVPKNRIFGKNSFHGSYASESKSYRLPPESFVYVQNVTFKEAILSWKFPCKMPSSISIYRFNYFLKVDEHDFYFFP